VAIGDYMLVPRVEPRSAALAGSQRWFSGLPKRHGLQTTNTQAGAGEQGVSSREQTEFLFLFERHNSDRSRVLIAGPARDGRSPGNEDSRSDLLNQDGSYDVPANRERAKKRFTLK
jgi:hypothetical protein